ncbi:MAG: hypothetical protein U9Q79_00645 [Candidatus Hydrogenedentes bacterium]|nr:hypothetical protein [Candidatus Hydrogenedentota bacterium]
MEAEVAPKSTTLVFVVVCLLEIGRFLVQAILAIPGLSQAYRRFAPPAMFYNNLILFISVALASVIALG